MSAKPWFAFYPGDYAAKTRGLTMLEHGAYWLLLTAYYSSGKPLPSEATRIMRIVGAVNNEEVQAVLHVLNTYFTEKEGLYHHKRADAEIAKRDNFHQALSEAGRKGGLSKAGRVASGEAISEAVASPQPQPQPQSQLQPPRSKDKLSPTGSRLTVETLPEEWKTYSASKRPDLDAETVFVDFRDYWIARAGKDGRKADWFATWRRWVRNTNTMVAKKTNGTPWWASDASIEAKAKELGIPPRAGESWQQLKGRINEKLGSHEAH